MTGYQNSSAADIVHDLLASAPAQAAATGGDPVEALEQARPARTAAARIAAAGGADEVAAGRLRTLVRECLGGSGARWLAVHDALAGCRGTLPALLADASPPQPAAPSGGLTAPVPRSVQETFALVIGHAAPEHAAAALAAIPDRTLERLLSAGALPGPALVAAVTEHGDSRTRVALARHPRIDTRVLARLLAVGDGTVGAAVYRNPRATPSLRRTLAHRLDAVPMDEALRAELADPGSGVPRTWLVPLLGSGDPQLVARALGSGVRAVAQQYALVRVWERGGPEAVRALLGDPGVAPHVSRSVRAAVTAALAEEAGEDTPGVALHCLREQGEPYADPGRLPGLLAATRGTSSLRDLLLEPYAQDLPALTEAHAKSPFMPTASEELARHEEASDAQRLLFRLSVLNEPWREGGRRAGNITPPERRLAAEELDDGAVWWAEGMVAAGLLDPVELIRTARPARHALAALAAVDRRGLVTDGAVAELRSLTDAQLGDRELSWAAFDRLLPGHGGSLRELITEAGRTAAPAESAAPAGPGEPGAGSAAQDPGAVDPGTLDRDSGAPAEPYTPPPTPRRDHERAALAALDLLRSLAPAGMACPDPVDPGVLHFLAHHDQVDAPGLATPVWLARACAAAGVDARGGGPWYTAPGLARVRATQPQSWGSGAMLIEHAYVQGILPADELPSLLPALRMLLLPHDWRRLSFAEAWRRALARLLRTELGTDPDAWLRLAATAEQLAGRAPAGSVTPVETHGPSWVELLAAARSGATSLGETPAASAPGEESAEEPAWAWHTPRPGTPDEAIALLARGNHLWDWPAGTLLCLADAEVIDAVLPRLGPDGAWLLAAYVLRHDRVPRVVFERLLAGRDPRALRILITESRWLDDGLVEPLAEDGDPEADLALLRHVRDPLVVRRVVARSVARAAARTGVGPEADADPVASRVLAELRADPAARPAGGAQWLCSAEPDLIEEILARYGTELGFVHQAVGCLHLLRYGGAARLTALVGRELLGQAATKLCVKALATADPAAVLRARIDRERDPARLIRKLRRCTNHWAATSTVVATLADVDWPALEAAHVEEPLPFWKELVGMSIAPTELRLRYPELLPEPGPYGLPDGVAATRSRARHGLAGLYHCPPATQIDGLLSAGMLTGTDLLHTAAPAARILAYLSSAARRTDTPAGATAALEELAGLVRTRLGADPASWARVTERLTGRDPGWEPMAPVVELLA
ncbi:hypothetical protein SAMN05216223_101132 [Actinacidiphila yanglinensis]|uniref:Uncharacterized protein n=1 Tax=Actinacidiphila yanglinensis TaxID=310779 RepID=A0A1H5SHE0_9ACTN|nr:hypothetical protein [Actinacidiphila yanglinensis]SEF50036.1 hypothetical protein SAMN05216223_101132 [Actinacidiphila yanglinensis]